MSNPTDKNTESKISEAQILANQLNAQKSTGPRSEAGKARSRMNARRHGLTGQFYVMNEADRVAYEAFEKSLLAALKPIGAYEHQLAVSISQDHWRINRSRAIEFNTLGLGHEDHVDGVDTDSAEVEAAVTQARTWQNEHGSMTNIVLYENRVNRMIDKNEKRLAQLQQERKTAEATAREEAELLHCYAVMNGEPTKSTDVLECNGFVFSRAQIAAGLQRKADLTAARYYKTVGWDRTKEVPNYLGFPLPTPGNLKKAA